MPSYQVRKRSRFSGGDAGGVAAIIAFFAFVLTLTGAWITHVVWIIGKLASDGGATAGQMVLGAIGAFMPPVGIIHGLMIWFGKGF